MTDPHSLQRTKPVTDSILASENESWVSAFFDGEAMLSEQGGWTEAIQNRLYYYTITRQVLRGEPMGQAPERRALLHRTAWTAFWARIDAI
jgi:hypothetical protein